MKGLPEFMKNQANRIASASQATPGVKGCGFDRADGSQDGVLDLSGDRIPCRAPTSRRGVHASRRGLLHAFDWRTEDRVEGRGRVPPGVSHAGEVVAGTRTIHAFDARRAERINGEQCSIASIAKEKRPLTREGTEQHRALSVSPTRLVAFFRASARPKSRRLPRLNVSECVR